MEDPVLAALHDREASEPEVLYQVMIKEHGRWDLVHNRYDLVEAFLDADRISDQEYLYDEGSGIEVGVFNEAEVRKGKMLPIRRTEALKKAIKERLEQKEAAKAVVVDTETIAQEKPLWDKFLAARPESSKEPVVVEPARPDEPDKAPKLSKELLAWLKK